MAGKKGIKVDIGTGEWVEEAKEKGFITIDPYKDYGADFPFDAEVALELFEDNSIEEVWSNQCLGMYPDNSKIWDALFRKVSPQGVVKFRIYLTCWTPTLSNNLIRYFNFSGGEIDDIYDDDIFLVVTLVKKESPEW